MLEKIDLTQKVGKKLYKRIMPDLQERLHQLQKLSWDAGIPVIILFEGWDAAGKGAAIKGLTSALDPRGFKLYPILTARPNEKKRPWMWRFWLKLPSRGEWAIFDRSWYGRVFVERMENLTPESEWRQAYRDIVDFERTNADDGAVIVKFFLHISKDEQKKRFKKLDKGSSSPKHVTARYREQNRHYDDWLLAYEECFELTDSEWGSWTIVEATHRRFTRLKIFQTIIQALEERLGLEPIPLPSIELQEEETELEKDGDSEPETVELPGVLSESQDISPNMEAGQMVSIAGGDGAITQAEDVGEQLSQDAKGKLKAKKKYNGQDAKLEKTAFKKSKKKAENPVSQTGAADSDVP